MIKNHYVFNFVVCAVNFLVIYLSVGIATFPDWLFWTNAVCCIANAYVGLFLMSLRFRI